MTTTTNPTTYPPHAYGYLADGMTPAAYIHGREPIRIGLTGAEFRALRPGHAIRLTPWDDTFIVLAEPGKTTVRVRSLRDNDEREIVAADANILANMWIVPVE